MTLATPAVSRDAAAGLQRRSAADGNCSDVPDLTPGDALGF